MSYNGNPSIERPQMSKSPSTGTVLLHVFLTFITGGLWLIVLLIKWLLTK